MEAMNNLLNAEFNEDTFFDLMPEWKGSEIKITVLSGGITNKLYWVHSKKGDVTVRIYGEKTELFIDRDLEADAIEKMAKVGISPGLIKYMPDRKVTIVEFIPGYVLKNPDFIKDEFREKIVSPIRRIHNCDVVLPKLFNPHTEVKKMAGILDNLGAKYSEFDIAGTIGCLGKMFEIINIPENEYTVSHNDLLADNFILVTDGYGEKYSEPMYIIDWEYAGMAPGYYDIADMFQEILVPRDIEKKIVEHYCQGKEFDKNLYLIDVFKPFPDIYWFLWSMIKLNISKIEFDFYHYGKVKYENAQHSIDVVKK